jgi:hypothetical protein
MNDLTAGSTHFVFQLATVNEPVAIRDKDGDLMGIFIPNDVGARQKPPAEMIAALETIQKSEKRAGKGKSTAEVFEHLLTLTTDPGERAALERDIKRLRESA